MNIFVVSYNPKTCAQALDDLRLRKMVLETAQMLCTVLNLEAGSQVTNYRVTHAHNPLTKWAKNETNWAWLWELGDELGNEYIHRFDSRHASHLIIQGLTFRWPDRCETELRPKWFHNAAANKSLDLDFTHLPVREAYREYLTARWNLQATTPRKNGSIVPPIWTRRRRPNWY